MSVSREASAPVTDSVAPGQDGQLRHMARGSGLNLAGAIVSGLSSLALVVVLARTLSQERAGLFFTATSVFLLLSVLAKMGTLTGLVYYVSQLRTLGRQNEIRQCLSTALRPVVMASVATGAMLALAGVVVRTTNSGPASSTLAVLLWTLAPFVPAAAISDSVLAATRGFGTMRPTVLIENITRSGAQFVLCALAAALSGRASLIALGWALPYVASAAWAAMRLRRLTVKAEAGRTPADKQPGFARQFWSFTAPRAMASVAQLLLQRLDVVLVAVLSGPVSAAIYTAASRLLVAGQLGGSAISNAVQPQLAATLATGDIPKARQSYQAGTAWLVLLTWPFYLMCISYAPFVLRLFGHRYTQATDVVVILTSSMLLATACGMVDLVLTMGGRTRWNLYNVAAALVVNVGVDVALIPPYGVTGAAIGWAAAIVVNNLVPLAQIWHAMRLHPFGKATLTALAVSTAAYGVLPGVLWAAGWSSPVAAALTVAISTVVYAGLVWRTRQRLGLLELIPRWPIPLFAGSDGRHERSTVTR